MSTGPIDVHKRLLMCRLFWGGDFGVWGGDVPTFVLEGGRIENKKRFYRKNDKSSYHAAVAFRPLFDGRPNKS